MFVFRKIKTEQELGRKTWLVEYSDIQIRKGRLNDSFLSKSLLTLDTKVCIYNFIFCSELSCKEFSAITNSRLLRTLGYYKLSAITNSWLLRTLGYYEF